MTDTKDVERLLDGVTPGPWEANGMAVEGGCERSGDVCYMGELAQYPGDIPRQLTNSEANARFIAASRELVPALLSERDALAREVERLTAERDADNLFGDHVAIVRGIISAAGDLPSLNDGPFRDGFISGMEEVAARADISAGDGNRQMQDLVEQITALVTGTACIIMERPETVVGWLNKLAAIQPAPDTMAQVREALDNIRDLNMTAVDENGHRWANSDLIEQEIIAALALLTKEG